MTKLSEAEKGWTQAALREYRENTRNPEVRRLLDRVATKLELDALTAPEYR